MKKILIILLLFVIASCTNPFAPKLADRSKSGSILADQTQIDGLFENFRYAYIFKDTLVYGKLLSDDFRFIFRNHEKGIDESWGRTEDMITTSRLFSASKSIDLTWNDVTIDIGDSVLKDISRAFNMKIVFSSVDVVNIFGRVNMRVIRNNSSEIWKIQTWKDESNF